MYLHLHISYIHTSKNSSKRQVRFSSSLTCILDNKLAMTMNKICGLTTIQLIEKDCTTPLLFFKSIIFLLWKDISHKNIYK